MPPAIGLLGAAASVTAGVSAIGAAGFAAASLGTQLVAGAMIAGGVMAGVGSLTGNKKLQKWGGVLSLAGGVGGLATGAWSSAAGEVAGQAAQESFRAAELGAQAAGEAAGGLAGSVGSAAGGLAQANAGALGTSDIGIGAASAGNGGAPMISTPTITPPSSVNLANAGGSMSTAAPASTVATNPTGMLQSAMTWAEKNPRLAQAGAGMLQAGLGAYGQQEALKTQIKLQEEAQARARQRLNDSVKGIQVPVYQRAGG